MCGWMLVPQLSPRNWNLFHDRAPDCFGVGWHQRFILHSRTIWLGILVRKSWLHIVLYLWAGSWAHAAQYSGCFKRTDMRRSQWVGPMTYSAVGCHDYSWTWLANQKHQNLSNIWLQYYSSRPLSQYLSSLRGATGSGPFSTIYRVGLLNWLICGRTL